MPVRQTGAIYTGTSDTHVIPLPAACLVGNGITLKFYKASDAVSITSVLDSTGTALSNDGDIAFETDNSGHFRSIFGLDDTPSSVTVTLSASASISAYIKEVSGVGARRAARDVGPVADGEGFATAHSWEYDADATDDLVEALGGIFTGFVSDTATATGNTVIESGSGEFTAVGYEFAPASGAGSITFNLGSTRQCAYALRVYQAAAAAAAAKNMMLLGVG